MTPAARLAAAIEILTELGNTDRAADRLMRDYFRARRFAGSKDRRAIAERVYFILRHRAHLAFRMGGEDPRRLAIAALLSEGMDPDGVFAGGYGPAPLTAEERAAIGREPGAPPLWVEGEFPAFLEDELKRAFGDDLLAEMAAFGARAPVDLRVNGLKSDRETVLARLAADGIAASAIPGVPTAIRCNFGSNLTDHPLYRTGAFEVQDVSAQIAAQLAEAKPGMRVLDLAAGAGGKALALAAAMENRGEIVACDVRPEALAELGRRAARAGAGIIHTHLLGRPPDYGTIAGSFDLVFIDAPCSGSGTWRRQPEAKWRLTADRLAALMAVQDRLLAQGAGFGPRLIYATCSVLPCENQDRVGQFLTAHPRFARAAEDFRASPASTGGDGFFAATLRQN